MEYAYLNLQTDEELYYNFLKREKEREQEENGRVVIIEFNSPEQEEEK